MKRAVSAPKGSSCVRGQAANPRQTLHWLRRCPRLAWRSGNSLRTLEIARQRILDSNALHLKSLSHSAVKIVLGFSEVYERLQFVRLRHCQIALLFQHKSYGRRTQLKLLLFGIQIFLRQLARFRRCLNPGTVHFELGMRIANLQCDLLFQGRQPLLGLILGEIRARKICLRCPVGDRNFQR